MHAELLDLGHSNSNLLETAVRNLELRRTRHPVSQAWDRHHGLSTQAQEGGLAAQMSYQLC